MLGIYYGNSFNPSECIPLTSSIIGELKLPMMPGPVRLTETWLKLAEKHCSGCHGSGMWSFLFLSLVWCTGGVQSTINFSLVQFWASLWALALFMGN